MQEKKLLRDALADLLEHGTMGGEASAKSHDKAVAALAFTTDETEMEKLREGIVFDQEAELTWLYPSGKCAIFEGKNISIEIMDSTCNEEAPAYQWESKRTYRVYVVKEEGDADRGD